MSKIVFFGTPEYVVPILEALKNAGHEIAAVVTQPPKPAGRKKILTPSPVAQWAEKHKITVLTNSTLLHKQSLSLIRGVEKVDVGILAAYGRIIPKNVIDYFPHGILNVHPSLLPKYRGASPVQAAIMAGDKETGVTIIKLDEEVDHGPIVHQFKEPVREDDTTGTLRERLFEKAVAVLPEIFRRYVAAKIHPREQEHDKATFTTLIKKGDGFIETRDLATALGGKNSQKVERFIRAMSPWPGAFTKLKMKNEKLKILKILKAHAENGTLVLEIVQLEGKNPVTWKQFKEGYPETNLI